MAETKTIKELMELDVCKQPFCIEYPALKSDFHLRSSLIHLLPKFYGLENEDPYKHLKEFHHEDTLHEVKHGGTQDFEGFFLHQFQTRRFILLYLTPTGSPTPMRLRRPREERIRQGHRRHQHRPLRERPDLRRLLRNPLRRGPPVVHPWHVHHRQHHKLLRAQL
ncbi:hypothetical protein OROMI_023943 [Orobanche minor]